MCKLTPVAPSKSHLFPATIGMLRLNDSLYSASAAAAGIVNSAAIGLVLLCLTPVFEHLPMNALAAIVITGVLGLLDFQRLFHLIRVKPQRFLSVDSAQGISHLSTSQL